MAAKTVQKLKAVMAKAEAELKQDMERVLKVPNGHLLNYLDAKYPQKSVLIQKARELLPVHGQTAKECCSLSFSACSQHLDCGRKSPTVCHSACPCHCICHWLSSGGCACAQADGLLQGLPGCACGRLPEPLSCATLSACVQLQLQSPVRVLSSRVSLMMYFTHAHMHLQALLRVCVCPRQGWSTLFRSCQRWHGASDGGRTCLFGWLYSTFGCQLCAQLFCQDVPNGAGPLKLHLLDFDIGAKMSVKGLCMRCPLQRRSVE